MSIQVINPPVTSGSIVAALGFTPAATAISPIPVGTAAAPGAGFLGATDIGFYLATNSNNGIGMAVAGTEMVQLYFRTAASLGFDNTWMIIGPPTDITVETTDTYVTTITPPSLNWSGTASRPVGLNFGTWSVTITDQITKTALALMGEFDKLDIYQSGGAVTVNRAAGWRVRSPIPHAGVTLVQSTALMFSDPTNSIEGSVTNHAYINIPATAGGANGPTTTQGILFQDNPNGGSIATASTVSLSILAGTGTGTGDVTVKGSNTILDNRTGSGGAVWLYSGGNPLLKTGTVGAGANRMIIDANNTPMLRADHASTADVSLNISSKGTGTVSLMSGAGARNIFRALDFANAVNYGKVTASPAGAAVAFGVDGTDTDIDLSLVPKGAGVLKFGAVSAIVAETVTGYISIKDSAGNVRKLAVVS